MIDRYATRDVELGGVPIAAGDLVRLSLSAANRDPAFFTDPDRFDVLRDNARHHVAFAHGPHVCLGMHLSRLETHVALAALLDRLPGLRLVRRSPPRREGSCSENRSRCTWSGTVDQAAGVLRAAIPFCTTSATAATDSSPATARPSRGRTTIRPPRPAAIQGARQ